MFRPAVEGDSQKGGSWRLGVEANAAVEEAERLRLIYVAVTRAQREVFFVGPIKDETISPDLKYATAGTFAATLEPWLHDAERGFVKVLQRVPAPEPLPPRAFESVSATAEDTQWAAEAMRLAEGTALPKSTRVAMPVTTFETYAQCMRRGMFVHELRLEEPRVGSRALRLAPRDLRDPPINPLERGRLAHGILAVLHRRSSFPSDEAFVDAELSAAGFRSDDERLGDVRADVIAMLNSQLGQQLIAVGPEARRHEMPFELAVGGAEHLGIVRGQIDLLYWDDAGPVVIDFKHAKAGEQSSEPYANQLDAYALAVARLCELPADATVRTRLVFLRGAPKVVERDVTEAMRDAWRTRVANVVASLATRRLGESPWPGRNRAECDELHCGFVSRCHGTKAPAAVHASKQANSAGQLSLFGGG